MRVTFLPFAQDMASARLRGSIPQRELKKLGVLPGTDILVVSKHGWKDSATRGFKKIVFDVCDDHFHDHLSDHYRKWCIKADLITCNSLEMHDLIMKETGRHATIIHDPYEQPLREPKCSRPPLWFGIGTNFGDIFPYTTKVPDLICVSNLQHPKVIVWTPEIMDRMYDRAGIVLIPVGEKKAKSANRAVDSIRRGLYPCTGRLQAYEELGLGTNDILAEMDMRLSDPEQTKERISHLQDLVEFRFNPRTIAQEWNKVLSSI